MLKCGGVKVEKIRQTGEGYWLKDAECYYPSLLSLLLHLKYRLFDLCTMRLLIFSLLFLAVSCGVGTPVEEGETLTYFCGAENKVDQQDPVVFDDGSGEFTASGYQVTDSVFEGKYSLMLDSTQQYGMGFKLQDVVPGTYFEISVWIKKPVGRATIIASTSGHSSYSLNTTDVNRVQDSLGWSKYFLSFGVETTVDTLTVFLFSPQEKHYFDNLEIKQYAQRPAMPDSLKNSSLKIYIPDSAETLLAEYREKALAQSVISADLKKYVDAFIIREHDSIPIELRLKGDWTDHLEQGKTSYRIKTDQAYKGLTSFSIQHPQTRNFMHEWFIHQLCEREGVLATTYDFLPVEINGVNQGIYALEEHFDKQVIESRNLREGPILKFDEAGFWALLVSGMKDSLDGKYPYFESSMITCFKQGRTAKSPTLSAQFENAANLLYLFKTNSRHPEDIFDIDKLARYYALMDLGNVQHSLAWHNRRFYYNPITTRLEIIGFDMIPAILPYNPLIANNCFKSTKYKMAPELTLDFYLFANPDFREAYTYYNKRFNSVEYLDSIFKVLDSDIKQRENLLSVEFKNYHLDREFYYNKAAFNREQIVNLDKNWDTYQSEMSSESPINLSKHEYAELQMDLFIKDISVNAYRNMIDSAHYLIQLENYHGADVTITGYSTKGEDDYIYALDKPLTLKRFDGVSSIPSAELHVDKKPNKIFFTVANIPGETKSKKIFDWPKPTGKHPRLELAHNFQANSSLYQIQNDTLIFKRGSYQINKMIYIPADYSVRIEAGTQIDLVQGAGLIFNGSTEILGTTENPVIFNSSDLSSKGITILQGATTRIEHTRIFNQGTLDYKGWTLTGALTVYEGTVSIKDLEIAGNTCEDALNIVRGHFEITDLFIHETHGDAFDADFCTGNISASKFSNTGNDCIDFSGSVADISGITVFHSGDKGISSGERSVLNVSDIHIDGALTALASKDGSILTATGIDAKNCDVGVALFRKKPEYDYSRLILNEATWENIGQETLIEKGAILTYKGACYFGYTTFDIESMYARFSK